MKKIINVIKHIPKPYQKSLTKRPITYSDDSKIAWYFYGLFFIFFLFGMNIFFTKNTFFASLILKITWIIMILNMLHSTIFNFAEGFIFYTIMICYLFHFFDIFLLLFFAIFLPNGHKLIKD